jgi:hypothetical protein
MVGSKDFFDKDIDGQVNVTLSPRQPGSSFKPIVYSLAFVRGYLPETQLWDVNTTYSTAMGPYSPRDYDLKERGPLSIRQALQGSLNSPAVQALYLVGVGSTIDYAQQLGYTTLEDRSRFGLALVLGGAEVKPIEHASAFGAFANEGVLNPTSAILKVQDNTGAVLEEWKQPIGKRVMEPQISRLISNVLSDNQARAYIFGLNSPLTLPGRTVAVKTGTTNDFKDGWTVGYTPSLVTAVWAGNSDGTNMKRGADGSVIAAPIWHAYMADALKGTKAQQFAAPEPPTTQKPALLGKVFTQKIKIDRVSGKLATDLTPAEDIVERSYIIPHSLLFYVDKDDPTGSAPTNPANDPQFANWEQAVQMWVAKNVTSTNGTPPTEYDDVHTAGTQPKITIFSPTAGQTISIGGSLHIQATIDSPRTITRFEVVIDGSSLTALGTPPWDVEATLPSSIQDGMHNLLIRATDNLGQRGETQVTIQVGTGVAPTPITIPTPAPAPVVVQPPTPAPTPEPGPSPDNSGMISIKRVSLPRSVTVTLASPEKFDEVDVRFVSSDGGSMLVASAVQPLTSSARFSITHLPSPGAYTLRVIGFDKDGNVLGTAEQGVTVE